MTFSTLFTVNHFSSIIRKVANGKGTNLLRIFIIMIRLRIDKELQEYNIIDDEAEGSLFYTLSVDFYN